MLGQELHLACSRARVRLVLAYPRADDRGEALRAAPALEEIRAALGADWQDREEELFGPAEALHSTYRLLRDELLQGTMRAGGRIGELRLDTGLDISHAVVRYLELLKVAALIAQSERDGGPAVAESLRDINARIRRRSRESSARSTRPPRWTSTCWTPSAAPAPGRRRSPPATSPRWRRSCRCAARASCCRPPTSTRTAPAR